jgi:phenylacetate-CoA ligase
MSAFQKQILEMLLRSQYWPPDQMLAYQRSQLSQLLHHARAQVPFYKNRLDPVFRGNGGIDWNRWNEIPIVTRADLRDRRNEMLAVTLPPSHGPSKTFHSSGSSGVPIAMETTKIALDANRAAATRFYELQGIDSKKTRATLSNTTTTGEMLREEFYFKQLGRPSAGAEYGGRKIVLNRNLPESRKLDLLESEGVTYLSDIPNNTEVLALANLSRKIPVKLDAILCSGQGLTVDQRNLFQESFGARSISVYSSEEGGMMACQCGDSFHYHLNPEIVLVEILTPDGNAYAPGEPGRVVITPFFSTALPLIRYDQGDTAELLPPCTCKSRLPVLGKITGRQDQLLQFPDGLRSATGINQKLLRENLNALAFQLAQIATFKLELRFVSADVNKQVNADPIIAHIRELIHPKLEVILKPVEKIPLNSGGKQQRIVCEIAPQS